MIYSKTLGLEPPDVDVNQVKGRVHIIFFEHRSKFIRQKLRNTKVLPDLLDIMASLIRKIGRAHEATCWNKKMFGFELLF